MSAFRRKFLAGAVALGALVACGSVIPRQLPEPAAAEYPDPPFHPVGPDFPHFIPLAERPTIDDPMTATPAERQAWYDYWQERRRIQKELREHGAYARMTVEEKKAFDADWDNKPIDARELAEKVLKEHPESVPAQYVLAGALAEQANLPQALFRIREMRHALEARGRYNPDDADSREWYLRGLHRENYILSLMDRRADELRTVELIEKVYGHALPWEKFWPLIKLKRFAEAQVALEQTAATGSWPRLTLNNRIVMEAQQKRRTMSYEVGKKCVEDRRATAVVWKNFTDSCLADFRLREAEEALKQSLAMRRNFIRTPYLDVASFQLFQARLPQAWEALLHADAERKNRDAITLEQDRADMAAGIAALMLVLSNAPEAERRAREAWEQPSRHGSSTGTEQNAALSTGVLLWNALLSRSEELKENGAASWAGLVPDGVQQQLDAEAWTTKRALLKLLGDEKFLNECLRPYLPDSPGTESWLMGTFMQILPTGVAAEALRQARASESHPKAVGYFDALEAELELRRGNNTAALELARKALENLPVEERLLRARTAAVAGEACFRQRRTEDGLIYWGQALADFPAVTRLLQLAIPVQVEDDGSPLARQLRERLLRSPRLHADPAGLHVVLRTEGAQLSFALFRPADRLHFTASVPVSDAAEEVLTAAVKLFHDRLMSPDFILSTVEINRLGSTAGGAKASKTADDLLKRARENPDTRK